MRKIFLYSDYYMEFELINTNIPADKIQHFIFLYCNCRDLKIDFFEIVKNAGFIWEILETSKNTIFFDGMLENEKFCVSDYFLDN